MNSKVAVLLAVVIVVAAGGAYYFMTKEKPSDYTILDSSDNIKAGLTIKYNTQMEGTNNITYVVDSVDGTTVHYHSDAHQTMTADEIWDLSDFAPNGTVIGFDYTTEPYPEGIHVTVSGSEYVLNGTASIGTTMTVKLENLVIDYNGASVTSVMGKVNVTVKSATNESTYDCDLSTQAGTLKGNLTSDTKRTAQIAASDFYGYILLPFSTAILSGTDYQESTGQLGNVTATVYTVNGTNALSQTFENVHMYVYDGYILKADGKQNGTPISISTSVYYA